RESQFDLEVSRERYRELYHDATVGYVTLDHAGKIVEANRAAAELLGLQRKELEAGWLSSFMTVEDSHAFNLHRQRVAEGDRPRPCELHLITRHGQSVPVRLDASPCVNPAGGRGLLRCV